jgi:hypothetical protein
MKKQFLAAVVVAVAGLGLAGSLAWAADTVSLNVPFSFIVKDKEMPAGRYLIMPQGTYDTALVVRSDEGGGMAVAPVIERLANTGAKEAKVVFDKMPDGKTYLSEVHVPGIDGFLVGIAGGKETHEVITGKQQKQP